MRIALYHNLPGGGAKRATYEAVRRLAQRHEVDCFTLSSAEHDFCDLRPYVQQSYVYCFHPLPLFSSPWGRLNQVQRLRDLGRLELLNRRIAADINAGSYDVVYVHPCMWLQAPTVLNYARTPTVYHLHESLRSVYEPVISRPYAKSGWREHVNRFDPLIALYRRALARLDRRNARRATRLLTNSRFTESNVRDIYGRAAQTSYFGVDSQMFRPDADTQRLGFVLSVGSLQPHKGYDFLIESIGRIPATIRPPLRIVANACDRAEHHYLVHLAAMRGVTLTIEVMVDSETLIRRYNEASLLLYAPVREPLGLAALEAMACATPVVGVAEGGVRETVVDGVTGLLTPRDPAHFAAAVEQLLVNPGLARRMGEAGRAHVVAQWNWESCVDRIEAALAAAPQSPSMPDRRACHDATT